MNVYDQLITNGYYVGKSTEILSPFELSELRHGVEHDIKISFTEEKNNDWMYFLTCAWSDNKDDYKNKPIPYENIQEKLNLIAQEDVYIQQSWFYKAYTSLKKIPLPKNALNVKLTKYISKIYNLDFDNIDGTPTVTYYRKNDFISVHRDGKNEDRICGMLIYLGSPIQYKQEFGGRLLLRSSQEQTHINPEDYHIMDIKVEPVAPNMVILDFSKHDIFHAVEKCTENFYRTALITFFSLKNSSPS